jgi:hypothetical protein
MTTSTTRRFSRFDAAAIRRAARAWFKMPTAIVEAGERYDAAGCLTVDSSRWPEDSDLYDMEPELRDIREDIAPGFTLDLYVYHRAEDGDTADLEGNLDARWTGTEWEVFDPFRPARVERATPAR